MRAEEFVKSKYDIVRAESYKSGRIKGMQTTYWLIWVWNIGEHKRRIGEGSTKSKAFKDAKENILIYESSLE